MHPMRSAVSTLLLVFVACCPAGAQVQKTFPFTLDDRLAKPVTARWKKITLGDALKEIGTATHVALTADPRVADEPLMASAAQIPARDLLIQIGKLTHFTWRRHGGK